MEDLFAKIRAEIDKDEQLALAVNAGEWDDVRNVDGVGWNEWGEAEFAHVTRHDPARVLRQVAAHRMILELHQPEESPQPNGVVYLFCATCGEANEYPVSWPCPTVQWVADIYGIEVPDHG